MRSAHEFAELDGKKEEEGQGEEEEGRTRGRGGRGHGYPKLLQSSSN